MGLDVYLRRFEDFAKCEETEAEYEKRCEELRVSIMPNGWDGASEQDRQRYWDGKKTIAAEMGTDEYGNWGRTTIELPHEKYPEHYFKIGYFRSSYNSSGINSVLPDIGVPEGSLYEIFARNRDDDYHFQPNWQESLDRCELARVKLRERLQSPIYRSTDVDHSEFRWKDGFSAPSSSKDAADIFMRMKAEQAPDSPTSFGCGAGDFWMGEPLKVVAAIPGKRRYGSGGCTYLVYESDPKYIEWYGQALEIVSDTCRYVLTQPDPEKYYLGWSG